MHDVERTANLLGAAALAFTDLALSDAARAAKVSASGAAALVTLTASSDLSVTELGRRVGLSQSAAARMVDSLEAAELVERRPHPFNNRWVTVHPTKSGRRAAKQLLSARAEPLTEAVSALDEADQQALSTVLEKLLARLYDEVGDSQYLCRLCDRKCCLANDVCPIGAAERNTEPHA